MTCMLIPQSRQSAKLFLQSSELGPHPPLIRGKGHTRWGERGWESPNSDEGTYTVVLYINICMYFVAHPIWMTIKGLPIVEIKNHVEFINCRARQAEIVFKKQSHSIASFSTEYSCSVVLQCVPWKVFPWPRRVRNGPVLRHSAKWPSSGPEKNWNDSHFSF